MRFRGERSVPDEQHNTSGIHVGSPQHTALKRSAIVYVLFVLLVLVLAGTVWYWFPHVHFYLTRWDESFPEIEVKPLATAYNTIDWPVVRYGEQTLQLPPSLAIVAEDGLHRESGNLVFRDDTGREFAVSFPRSNKKEHREFQAYVAKLPSSTCTSWRETLLTARMYAASPSDFRWTMKREEVTLLAWLLRHKRIAAQPEVHSAEVREEDDWEGILLMGPSIASFVWYSKDGRVTGGLLFVPGSAEDVDWIRVVCSSFSPEEAIELRAGLPKE
jgi:hypothetical protein